MSRPTYRRRRYLIDVPMQLGLSLRLLAWGVGYFVIFLGLIALPVLWDGVFGHGEMRVATAILERLEGFAEYNFLALFVVLGLMSLHLVRFTHRFAGPVLRFRRALQDMARGVYPESVRLRRHDFLKEVAQELTLTLTALREQTTECRRVNGDTQRAARDLLKAATEIDVDPERLVLLAHEVLASAERLDRCLPHVGDTATSPDARFPAPEPADDSVPATDEAIAGPVAG